MAEIAPTTQASEHKSSILVVIPCLNEEQHIEKLVRALVAANENLPIRIVIADGGSIDQTPLIGQKLAEEFSNVAFLSNPKRIQSAAINLAVATYGQDARFLIRIDAHSCYPTNYCRALIEEAETTKAASVVVTMKTIGKGGFQDAVAAAQNSKLGNGGSAHRNVGKIGKWVDHGHHALMRIDAFRQIGGYDETFTHNEDAELDTRLRKAGHKIWLTNDTTMTYYPRSSPAPLFRQYFQYGYGRVRNIIKHRNVPKLRQMAPAAVLPAAVLVLISPLVPIAAFPLAAWVVLCLGYGVTLAVQSGDANMVLVGPAAMIMHWGWSLGFWRGVLDKLLGRI